MSQQHALGCGGGARGEQHDGGRVVGGGGFALGRFCRACGFEELLAGQDGVGRAGELVEVGGGPRRSAAGRAARRGRGADRSRGGSSAVRWGSRAGGREVRTGRIGPLTPTKTTWRAPCSRSTVAPPARSCPRAADRSCPSRGGRSRSDRARPRPPCPEPFRYPLHHLEENDRVSSRAWSRGRSRLRTIRIVEGGTSHRALPSNCNNDATQCEANHDNSCHQCVQCRQRVSRITAPRTARPTNVDRR